MTDQALAYIWKEEREILAQAAAAVPDDGVIVEIGTALGGTSNIFHQNAGKRGAAVYTVDISPCHVAREHLKDTRVCMITRTAGEFAAAWPGEVGRPIDLLFVDGDHSFEGVFGDLAAWLPLVRPGGLLLFHDYDPPRRGGLAHLAVRVCLDTVRRLGVLDHMEHRYKIFSGQRPAKLRPGPTVADCSETFLEIGRRARQTRLEVFALGVNQGLEALRRRQGDLDSLSACYCLDHALKADFNCLDMAASSFHDFRRTAENLYMLEQAFGPFAFPDDPERIARPETAADLSRLVAAEQIRLTLLRETMATLVDWDL